MQCWDRYWEWTKTDDFKARMRAIVHQKDFLADNYLSTDQRVPVTLLQTNACSPARDQRHRRQHLGQLLLANL